MVRIRGKKASHIADYNLAASTYDQRFTPCLGQRAAYLIEQLPVHPGQQILDLACGTGTISIPLARLVGPDGRVEAIDLSENMLAQCRSKAKELGLAQIHHFHADVISYLKALPSSSVDGVVSAWGLCYLPHNELFRQVGRILRPGGFVGILENKASTLYQVFDTFRDVLLELPNAMSRTAPRIDLPRNSAYLARNLRNRGFEVSAQYDGELVLGLRGGEEVIEYLRLAGVGAGYFDSIDPMKIAELERRFIEQWDRRLSSDAPPSVKHEFCAAVGILSGLR
jgi:ubiquinone/menaquinone biosynthesis C-methylase UbiE